MRIAVISNGAASLLKFRGSLMAKMAALGHEVLAVAPDHDAASRAALAALGVRPVDCAMARAGINPLAELAVILRLRRLLRRHRVDLCFACFLKPVLYGTIAAWLAGVPRRFGLIAGLGFAFSETAGPWNQDGGGAGGRDGFRQGFQGGFQDGLRGEGPDGLRDGAPQRSRERSANRGQDRLRIWLPGWRQALPRPWFRYWLRAWRRLLGRLRRWLLRWLVRRVILALGRLASARLELLLFQNREDLAECLARRMVAPRQARLIGATGVDLAEWRALPLPEAPVIFLLAARLLWDKGIGDFVAAARALRRSHPAARFVLLGGLDPHPAAISRAQIEAWVAEGLDWPGHVAVQPWLAQAHVFVLPSCYREGVPRSTQEAMACARAVITTDMPGCRETVVDGVNGLLVPPGDAAALAAAMRRLLVAPETIARMGAESRRLAEARFDAAVQDHRLLAALGLLPAPQDLGPAKRAGASPRTPGVCRAE